jgi:hypothetical protein
MYINGYVSTKMSAIRRCPLSRGVRYGMECFTIIISNDVDNIVAFIKRHGPGQRVFSS